MEFDVQRVTLEVLFAYKALMVERMADAKIVEWEPAAAEPQEAGTFLAKQAVL